MFVSVLESRSRAFLDGAEAGKTPKNNSQELGAGSQAF